MAFKRLLLSPVEDMAGRGGGEVGSGGGGAPAVGEGGGGGEVGSGGGGAVGGGEGGDGAIVGI